MNTHGLVPMKRLSDHALLARVRELARDERAATVALIAHLAELDRRRLYLAQGYASLFTYCTGELRLSEHAAYGRIAAARAARRFPLILDRLEDGSITLTTVCLLSALLTEENHREVLAAAACKSKRQVEELVARLRPLPPVPSIIRRLPDRRPVHGSASPRAVIAPLAPERYKIQFTASAALHAKLRQAQALLRHQIPDGDPAAVFDRALSALLDDLTRQKHAATRRGRTSVIADAVGAPDTGHAPQAAEVPVAGGGGDDAGARGPDRPVENAKRTPVGRSSRYIPSRVKREVWQRDGGRCAFVGAGDRRCAEEAFLEFHHVMPHSLGGEAAAANIQLRCRAHNGYEAEVAFGAVARAGPPRPGSRGGTWSGPSSRPAGDVRARPALSAVMGNAPPPAGNLHTAV